jgi:hypothetical protein
MVGPKGKKIDKNKIQKIQKWHAAYIYIYIVKILDQQALSLKLLSNSTKGTHSISCNIESTLLPWNFSYIKNMCMYIYIYTHTKTVKKRGFRKTYHGMTL